MEPQENTAKEQGLADEIRKLNKELLDFQGLPEDWHVHNESKRMKRSNEGRYINKP